jgi:hypothetical protein
VPAWTLVKYSPNELRSQLCADESQRATIEGKLHCRYFDEYFRALGAKTILVEEEYVDRDFLEDFAAYYVRCFYPYRRYCRRLHFFSTNISSRDFTNLLDGKGGDARALQKAYLGFIVVKPLPETVVGRTCLRTYPKRKRRSYPISRPYHVHLLGLDLSVETLAFQEQDRAAAACATSALWSAFQATALLFQHHIPSPVEITQSATERALLAGRALPNDGLTLEQMANAVRRVGLEPLVLRGSDPRILRSIVYAYCTGGVPVLIIGEMHDRTNPDRPRSMGVHAVAAAGFGLAGNSKGDLARSVPGAALQSSRIDRLYCHDDQVGPFARMIFSQAADHFSLTTSWRNEHGDIGLISMDPKTVMVPLYHKVRVRFPWILDHVLAFDKLLELLRNLVPSSSDVLPRLEWDISLITVDRLKREYFSGPPHAQRRALLERSLPRFLWRAQGSRERGRALDILFDATDIERSNCCVGVIESDASIGSSLRELSLKSDLSRELLRSDPQWWRIVERIVERR